MNALKKIAEYKCPKCKKQITSEVPCYALLGIIENNSDVNFQLKQNVQNQVNVIKKQQGKLRADAEFKLEV